MSYREHAPPAALARWLECAWERSGDAAVPVRVLPDGCIDIVWTEGSGTQVVGPNTTAFVVALASGVRVAGLRMRPGAGASLLGAQSAALRDGRVCIDDVWGDDGRRLATLLDEAGKRGAGEDDADDGVIATLLTACAERARRAPVPDPLVRAAVARLRDPRARVDTLAGELGVSARQLRRRFDAAVGYGPKRLARVLRLERALAAARGGEELAQAAAGAGFADQAHFAHDCRALAGVPPAALLH